MKKILLLQGANANFLGRREPEIYGSTTHEELDKDLLEFAKAEGFELEIYYTNIEGEAINRIQKGVDEKFDGLVMNPAGFTYAGFALKDCLKGISIPYVEIHISNIATRNIHSVTSECSHGYITGFGLHGYKLALSAMLHILEGKS